ncbi:MAG: SDR family NAD(P)-dependent oxidoreductase [Oscillospiraceae bacterium]
MTNTRFAGKTAWVTGADTPVGLAVARELWEEGASLLLSGLSSPPDFEGRDGQSIAVYPHNPVTDEHALAALELIDTPDITVTATRHIDRSSIKEDSAALFDRYIDDNLTATWCALKAAAGKLGKQHSGIMLVLSSIHGEKPTAGSPLFSVANGGMNMLVREAAQDMGRLGGRVNMLRYGPLEGDEALLQNDVSGLYHQVELRVSRGRAATPKEIARAALLLCSDDAAFINGAILTADGGFTGYYMPGDSELRWEIGYTGREVEWE